jgi:NADH:ubiquinone oxidoreductase subunit E
MDRETENIETILESIREEYRHKEIMKFLESKQPKFSWLKTGIIITIVILGVLMLWETNLAVTQMP